MAKISTRYRGKGANKTARGWQLSAFTGKSIFLSATLYQEAAARDCYAILRLLERDMKGFGEDGAGVLSEETETRLSKRPDFARRLAKAGLLLVKETPTVADLWARYFAAEGRGWKGATSENKASSRKRFLSFFAPETKAELIGVDDARRFVDWLDREAPNRQTGRPGLSEATRAGTIRDVRAAWNWGRKNGLVQTAPFNEVSKGSYVNDAKKRYIDMKEYRRLLDACPSQEWRVIVALCRIAGLRNPSETLALRWEDVDFERGCLTARSSKTERYRGKEKRTIPLFPELRRELEALREERAVESAAGSGIDSPFVIVRYRETSSNMRTTFDKIVFRAGLDRWPDPFQNLRKSAATDVKSRFGDFAESVWLGHSTQISNDHYQQIPPEVWRRAAFDVDAAPAAIVNYA